MHPVYHVIFIIKPLQRWLCNNQKIDILQLGRPYNRYISKPSLFYVVCVCVFYSFICSVHQLLESLQLHITQVRKLSKLLKLLASSQLELSAGKYWVTFGLSGGNVLMCNHSKERGQKQDTHTHTQSLHCNMRKLFSVCLPQPTNFCQRCRLNLGFSFLMRLIIKMVAWWCCLFATKYMFLSRKWRQQRKIRNKCVGNE